MQSITAIEHQIQKNITEGQLFFKNVPALSDLDSLFTAVSGPGIPPPTVTLAKDGKSLKVTSGLTFFGETVEITATLTQTTSTEQAFLLAGTLPSDTSFNIDGITWFKLESLTVFLNTTIIAFPDNDSLPDASMTTGGLNGKIILSKATLSVTLDFPNGNNTLWSINAKLSENNGAGIDILSELAGNDSWTSLIPTELHTLFTLQSVDLKVQFDPAAKTVPLLSLQVVLSPDFVVLEHPKFEITTITFFLVIQDLTETDKRRTYGTIQSNLKLLDSEFQLEATLPGLYLTGSLNPETPLDLTKLFSTYASEYSGSLTQSGITDKSDVTLSDLSVRLDVPNKSFWLYARSYMDWHLIKDILSLTALQLNLNIAKQDSTANVQASMAATFFIDEQTNVELQADFKTGQGLQFSGHIDEIPLGQLITGLADQLGFSAVIPGVLSGSTLNDISVSLDTSTKDFTFQGTCEMNMDGHPVNLTLSIDLSHSDDTYTIDITGTLKIDDIEFDVHFHEYDGKCYAIAKNENTTKVSLNQFIAEINPQAAEYCPKIEVEIIKPYLIFEKEKPSDKNVFIFGCDASATVSFDKLPVAGHVLGGISARDTNILFVSSTIDKETVDDINTALSVSLPLNNGQSLAKGFMISSTIDFNGIIPPLHLSFDSAPASTGGDGAIQEVHVMNPSFSVNGNPPDTSQDGSQASVGHSFGPVQLHSINMGLSHGAINFIIDASVLLGPFSMSFDGLQIANPLDKFDPSFNLNGLGINYSKNDVQIGGAFLREQVDGQEEYNGLINIGIKKLRLMAMGSYTEENHDPSFFIYGLLNYPVGGPSFFFVTGLAGAVGYNRNLLLPPVDQVKDFPLVAQALQPITLPQTPSVSSTSAMLTEMTHDIPVALGDYFFGLGVKFTSFKVIDSFVLLALKLNKEVEIDVLGLSRYVSPSPEDPDPVAVVELELLGQIIPEQGYAILQGQLTPASYVFSKDCHLSGGFAVAVWSDGDHAGNFVYSFGGYGNASPESYYPSNIPELEFLWRVNDEVTVKGGGYWTITSKFITAGGYLHATFSTGWVRAWFDLDAAFLIYWKPFHYQGSFHVDMGASVKVDLLFFHTWISVDVGADLNVSGPPFSGHAEIHLWIVSFGVNFGASPSQPPALIWNEFSDSFLPGTDEKILQLNVANGLIKTVMNDNTEWAIINAKDLEIHAQSMIPASDCQMEYKTKNEKTIDVNGNDSATDAGITAMNILRGQYEAPLTLTIVPEEEQDEHQLEADILLDNAPTAMWGNGFSALDNNAPTVISDTRKGISLKAKPANPVATHSVNRNELAWEWETFNDAYQWNEIKATFQTSEKANTIPFNLAGKDVNDRRNHILEQLGISTANITDQAVIFDEEIMKGTFS